MKVLVTGAAGYIGWAVVHELLAAGDDVIALVRQSDANFPPAVEKRKADLLDPSSLRAAMETADGVCHLAALTQGRASKEYPARYYRVNVAGTINVLEAMNTEIQRTGNNGSIVFASTNQVYGAPREQPISEDAPVQFINPYAATKVACEQLLGWQAATGEIGATTLRVFNAAGSAAGRGDPDLTRILPKTVAVAMGRADQVEVYGDGTAVRDYVDVKDVARAFVAALHANKPGHHAIYNVGATTASVRDVITSVERVTGQAVRVQNRPANPGEAPALTADTSRISAALGWQPRSSELDHLVLGQWSAAQEGQR